MEEIRRRNTSGRIGGDGNQGKRYVALKNTDERSEDVRVRKGIKAVIKEEQRQAGGKIGPGKCKGERVEERGRVKYVGESHVSQEKNSIYKARGKKTTLHSTQCCNMWPCVVKS